MRTRGNNRGQVLLLVALAMFVILGFAALAIDAGYMYSVRHELQRCADAGALAGASAFTTGSWDDPDVKSQADGRAREFATKDAVAGEPLTPRTDNVEVDFPRYDHIRVKTIKNVPLFFARIFGLSSKTITAYAVARAEVTDIKSDCVKPFAIPYPWNDEMEDPPYSLKDKQGEWNKLYDPNETVYYESPGLYQGKPMTIKVGTPGSSTSTGGGQQTSGQFFIIQGNNPSSDNPDVMHWEANDYRDYVDGGKCFNVSLSNDVDLLPGGKMGSTDQAVNALIASDTTGAYWDEDKKLPSDMSSTRVIRILMYDPSKEFIENGTTADILGGNYTVAGFWLTAVCGTNDAGKTITVGNETYDCPKDADKGAVVGRYIGNLGSGSSSGKTPENPTGTEVKKVALVE